MSAPLAKETAATLRHELRTPVNHILGYTEMLREDAADGSDEAARLDTIVAVGRDALVRINTALPPTGVAVQEDLRALLHGLRAPQSDILAAIDQLRQLRAGDAAYCADLDRIATAAGRLTDWPDAAALTATGEHTSRAATATPLEGVSAQVMASGPSASGRILVVDDVEENRSVLSRRLSREGYAVASVGSGEEALAAIADGGFDLVLLDVLMPGLDGFGVLERIKADPATRSIPVIMISALDDMASVVRCIEHGAEDYLAKPFDPVLLRARIGVSLEKKRWHDREADYLRQVTRVIDAASAVEAGTYVPGALASIVARDDELGRLARVFDTMAAGIRAREARLREQLRELRTDVSIATHEHRAPAPEPEMGAQYAPGTTLAGRYEILRMIGHGGMGVVYQVRDRELDEVIALKAIADHLMADDPVVAERFRSEIRLARRISHRNVVRTHDLGEADGVAFVTMEYVEGLTVRELLETRGKLGVSSVLALARQFTEALAVAHGAGVIHRDVKPENALVDAEGVLKVMDFGIARLAEASSTRTQTGMTVGTLGYMAPEQMVGEDVDARADLYALGGVIYECLTGHPPFDTASPAVFIAKVLTVMPTPPIERNPDVPPALSALVMQLLAKTPAERPASATALLELLGELG
ncbi:MAG: protein kinase [Gemmatimonadaceae bacterium]|nr:protein kinase [Gemmatimonadaceae bacterium]